MNSNINREATELQNEQTLYSTVPPQYPAHQADGDAQSTVAPAFQSAEPSQPTVQSTARQATASAAKPRKASLAKRVAVGAGAGIVIGGVAAAVMSMRSDDQPIAVDEDGNPIDEPASPETLQQAGVYDGQVAMATGVSDDMSFAEAFNAARQEVGPGGVFQWHGQLYGTYTQDEWNSMSPEQQQEYSDHFNWDNIDQPSGNQPHVDQSGDHTGGHQQPVEEQPVEEQPVEEQPVEEQPVEEQPVEEQPVEEQPTVDQDIPVQTNDDETQQQTGDDGPRPFTITEDSEVEVIGVVHDADSNQNVASIMVDGQQAILIDVDGDMEFDYIQADFDGDGQIASDEFGEYYDGQGPTVNDMGGFTDGYDPSQDTGDDHIDTPIDDDIPVVTNDDDITDDPIDNSDQIYDDI